MEHKKRLIDANSLKAEFTGNFNEVWHYTGIRAMIDVAPTVDAVEVVRCKHCKHRGDYPCPMYYEQLVEQNYGDGCIEYEWAEHDRTLDNGFCSMGERKDNG